MLPFENVPTLPPASVSVTLDVSMISVSPAATTRWNGAGAAAARAESAGSFASAGAADAAASARVAESPARSVIENEGFTALPPRKGIDSAPDPRDPRLADVLDPVTRLHAYFDHSS